MIKCAERNDGLTTATRKPWNELANVGTRCYQEAVKATKIALLAFSADLFTGLGQNGFQSVIYNKMDSNIYAKDSEMYFLTH